MPRIRHLRSGAGDMADLDVFEGTKEPDNLKQVDHHRNHNNRVQDAFDFAIHGNVGVHEPEKHSDNDQQSDDINERHEFFSSVYPHLKRCWVDKVPFGLIGADPRPEQKTKN
jgi:hypothetical protein